MKNLPVRLSAHGCELRVVREKYLLQFNSIIQSLEQNIQGKVNCLAVSQECSSQSFDLQFVCDCFWKRKHVHCDCIYERTISDLLSGIALTGYNSHINLIKDRQNKMMKVLYWMKCYVYSNTKLKSSASLCNTILWISIVKNNWQTSLACKSIYRLAKQELGDWECFGIERGWIGSMMISNKSTEVLMDYKST